MRAEQNGHIQVVRLLIWNFQAWLEESYRLQWFTGERTDDLEDGRQSRLTHLSMAQLGKKLLRQVLATQRRKGL